MRLRPTQENGLQPFSTFLTAAPLNECEIASHELTIEREPHGRDAGYSATWLIKNGQQVGCGELAPRAKVNLEISEAQWPTWNSDTALVDGPRAASENARRA
jgi:hypothetical protein